jgi:hypothetical protein
MSESLHIVLNSFARFIIKPMAAVEMEQTTMKLRDLFLGELPATQRIVHPDLRTCPLSFDRTERE